MAAEGLADLGKAKPMRRGGIGSLMEHSIREPIYSSS